MCFSAEASFAVGVPLIPAGIYCIWAAALKKPNVKRTGYGLGKHGWVSATFEEDRIPTLELLRQWVNESFRLVAPKKLVAALEELDGSDDDGEILRPLIRSRRTKESARGS